MRLYFLGTGAGLPSKERNTSSIALIHSDRNNETWLFDCGEATQHRIQTSPLRLSKINRIFITHLHGDHIFGLPGVLSSRSVQGVTSPLYLYGPTGLNKYVETSLSSSMTHLQYDLIYHEISDQQQIHIPNFIIHVAKLAHGIPSYGYRIEENDRPGELLVDQLKKLGIPPGPIYKRLKEGESVEWNGEIINGNDYLGPVKSGAHLTITGDTKPTKKTIELSNGADVLIHEATFSDQLSENAALFNHSTTTQAAQIAKQAGVKILILTHISPRFQLKDHVKLRAEATTIFANTYIAEDGWSFSVSRKSIESID
nr:ribonuclease Z [Seinonella peptonophila]